MFTFGHVSPSDRVQCTGLKSSPLYSNGGENMNEMTFNEG